MSGIGATVASKKTNRIELSIWWTAPAVVLLAVFFLVPLGINGAESIWKDGQISLDNYILFLSDPYFLGVIGQTLALSLGVTAISLLIGYPVAYFLVRRSGRWAGLIIFLLLLPLLTSIVMRTFGWRVLFARSGLVNSALMDLGLISTPLNMMDGPWVVVAAFVHVLVPFMVLSISGVLQDIDPRLEESARILGASKTRTFFSITLPLSMEGVGTGFILVFMLANGSFVTVLLLGGNIKTLALLIYQQMMMTRDFALARSIGNILLITALFCMYLQVRILKRRGL